MKILGLLQSTEPDAMERRVFACDPCVHVLAIPNARQVPDDPLNRKALTDQGLRCALCARSFTWDGQLVAAMWSVRALDAKVALDLRSTRLVRTLTLGQPVENPPG